MIFIEVTDNLMGSSSQENRTRDEKMKLPGNYSAEGGWGQIAIGNV